MMQVPGGTGELEEAPSLTWAWDPRKARASAQGQLSWVKPGEREGGADFYLDDFPSVCVQKVAGVALSCRSSGTQTPGRRGFAGVMAWQLTLSLAVRRGSRRSWWQPGQTGELWSQLERRSSSAPAVDCDLVEPYLCVWPTSSFLKGSWKSLCQAELQPLLDCCFLQELNKHQEVS